MLDIQILTVNGKKVISTPIVFTASMESCRKCPYVSSDCDCLLDLHHIGDLDAPIVGGCALYREFSAVHRK